MYSCLFGVSMAQFACGTGKLISKIGQGKKVSHKSCRQDAAKDARQLFHAKGHPHEDSNILQSLNN